MATRTVTFQASGAGKKNKDGSNKAKSKVDKIVDDSTPDQMSVAGQDDRVAPTDLQTPRQNVMDEQFPTGSLDAYDSEDEMMTTKLQMSDGAGMTPFGRLTATDADFNWLNKKRIQAEQADFEAWFAINFDRMEPAQKAAARELLPNFYQARYAQLDKNLDMIREIAKLKLFGPNEDNLYLQYALESGYINTNWLDNILHPEQAQANASRADRQATFTRGLLNPRSKTRQTSADREQFSKDATGFIPGNVPGMPSASGIQLPNGTQYGFGAPSHYTFNTHKTPDFKLFSGTV